ncbi:rhomboid family intramembrane serine protease [Flavobacteriaceae bacterium S356]|uniref:Rhomboid family intramembrane serine protease n=1 Tax=Asprobacillus argus TaxID=3076534 RepID=A0ABU3LJ03_9FLAO|nr:rhomboid family intramembrane serine protease [Flavobacteriaceae bacterium S356]
MERQLPQKINLSAFRIPILFVIVIWVVYWIEINFGWNFNKFGVFPRTFKGLRGVLFTHFIHSDTSHLFNNSIPILVLMTALFSFYKEAAIKVLVLGGLFSGLLTWIIARDAYHIGASGIVYLLFSFIFFSGIIRRHYRLIAVSLIVIFLYGSMVWYVLPIKEGMSWEGHLSGFIMGVVLALIYRKVGMVKEEFEFSQTDFDLLFDENGQLIDNGVEEGN